MAEMVIEQIRSNLFRAEIPLPDSPLKTINSYIIKDMHRNLIIDTGMNRKECREAFQAALYELDINLMQTDFFITHYHPDHIGLVGDLANSGSIIYFNKPDYDLLKNNKLWQLASSQSCKHGFTFEQVKSAIASNPAQQYFPLNLDIFTLAGDGKIIHYGDYYLELISTPGHTMGHTCLYERNLKLLFSGDHILGEITPNITTWMDDGNPLEAFLKSLDKIHAMEVNTVLPGHRGLISNCKIRIEDIKAHHWKRLEEVMAVIKANKRLNAYEVASQITWDLDATNWSKFPFMQKWFATAETLSHIHFLEARGKIKRENIDSIIRFSLLR